MKKRGPSPAPGAVLDLDLFMRMNCWRSERHHLKQDRTGPVMWTEVSIRERRMERTMVAKAALRSSRMRI